MYPLQVRDDRVGLDISMSREEGGTSTRLTFIVFLQPGNDAVTSERISRLRTVQEEA
jgi:hypothetical protein